MAHILQCVTSCSWVWPNCFLGTLTVCMLIAGQRRKLASWLRQHAAFVAAWFVWGGARQGATDVTPCYIIVATCCVCTGDHGTPIGLPTLPTTCADTGVLFGVVLWARLIMPHGECTSRHGYDAVVAWGSA